MLATATLGDVCDISLSDSRGAAPRHKQPFERVPSRLALDVLDCKLSVPGFNNISALTSSCSISTTGSLPIPVAKLQSLLLETPSFRALMNSNSAASFPERQLDGDDSYEEHLEYLLQRSVQLLKFRQDEDLFQKKVDSPLDCTLSDDDSSGSDSSSQAECGSRGSVSQESDPELASVLTTYYAPPRTIASLITLPSIHKALPSLPLASDGTFPTIPSTSSRSESLRSLESIEEAHKMIWQLETIAAELKTIDSSSVRSLPRAQPPLPATPSSPPSVPNIPLPPVPTIPLPPVPSSPSPLLESRLLPSPWSAQCLSPGDSRTSSLSGSSMPHSLAYLKDESTPSVIRQEQLLLDAKVHKNVTLPQIIVTEPSTEDVPAGDVLLKDATLLMDLVEDCYGDHWEPGRMLLYRTQAATLTIPEADSGCPLSPLPPRHPPSPPKSVAHHVTFDETKANRQRAQVPKKWYQCLLWGTKSTSTQKSSSCPPSLPLKRDSRRWYHRLFSRSRPSPSPQARPRPKNVRSQPISKPRPIVYRKSWPACAVDPARVRKSMGPPKRRPRRPSPQATVVVRVTAPKEKERPAQKKGLMSFFKR